MKVALLVITILLVYVATTSAIPIFAHSPDQEANDSPVLSVEVSRVKRGGFRRHEHFGRWYKGKFANFG